MSGVGALLGAAVGLKWPKMAGGMAAAGAVAAGVSIGYPAYEIRRNLIAGSNLIAACKRNVS